MITWITECGLSTSYSICINGSLHGHFQGKRGLRQGNPLSPYLFTLIMKVLTLMLQRRVRNSNLFTYHRYCSKLELINLYFADELFLFAHGDVDSARVIMDALEEFKLASGLMPSLPKSTTYFCNVLNHTKLTILQVLLFEEGRLPVKYLGVPLVSSRLIFRDCKELVEKVQNRINDWKNKPLSAVGRLQLIKSVISSMYIYWASGRAKVSWDLVCRPRKEGGLEIRRLDLFNKALMVTHIWNIISFKESLWLRPVIRDFIWFRIGDGMTVSAWFDQWCHAGPLSHYVTTRDVFRAEFNLALNMPVLLGSPDSLEWRDVLGVVKPFTLKAQHQFPAIDEVLCFFKHNLGHRFFLGYGGLPAWHRNRLVGGGNERNWVNDGLGKRVRPVSCDGGVFEEMAGKGVREERGLG
ncbi:putative reverse transcriptase domain, reverse transcriptase zinc-binding domain protein [Tanacetum coccineum]